MKNAAIALCLGFVFYCTARAQTKPATTQSTLGPDSLPQPGVPVGKTFNFAFNESKIFPGTSRTITVHVPAQYKGDKPACVYVGLDGLGFDAPVVFDNLIAKGDMPVTIAIGLSPGHVDSIAAPSNPRFNRSFEFDGMNDSLARFVLEEILPAVEKHKTPDGFPIVLSQDPNDRSAGGASTGGIGAFTLGWQRPDAFRRIFTAIGTFVGMRGGDGYPVLIRKTEPKPLRIFMQDGSSDEWGGGPEMGDWWMGNQTVERALEFSGYQVHHVWGTGGHSPQQATELFPDAMRWLWKDWPQPIVAGQSQNHFLKDILLPEAGWKFVASDNDAGDSLTSDIHGNVFFRDTKSGKVFKLPGDLPVPAEVDDIGGKDSPIAIGSDDAIYSTDATSAAIVSKSTTQPVIAKDIHANQLIVTDTRNIYATDGTHLWLIKPSGEKMVLDDGLDHATGIVLSPDHLWLAVFQSSTHWGFSYRVNADGTTAMKQRFYVLYMPDDVDESGAASACADVDGRLYVATWMGIQVLDRNGRTRAILPTPGCRALSATFGGTKFDKLFISTDKGIYFRPMKAPGVAPAAPPIKLPPWGAG